VSGTIGWTIPSRGDLELVRRGAFAPPLAIFQTNRDEGYEASLIPMGFTHTPVINSGNSASPDSQLPVAVA
jgi:hypothetical protein